MKKILRHSFMTRFEHWGIVVAGIILIATHEMQDKSIHIYAGIAFCLFLLLHIFRRTWTGFQALMKKGDIKESITIIKSFFVKGIKTAPQGKFLPEQRVVYTFCLVLCILIALSGISDIIYYYEPLLRTNTIVLVFWYIHHITAALFMLFFIVHIFFLLLPANRYLILSMITGRLKEKDVKEKHPKWDYED